MFFYVSLRAAFRLRVRSWPSSYSVIQRTYLLKCFGFLVSAYPLSHPHAPTRPYPNTTRV